MSHTPLSRFTCLIRNFMVDETTIPEGFLGGGESVAYEPHGLSVKVATLLLSSPRMRLSEIAERLRVERHTLDRALRKAMGKTFRGLRLQIVAKEAKALLAAHPPRAVKEVAFLLGYKSPQAFSHFVKRTLRTTPTAIRLRMKLGPRDY